MMSGVDSGKICNGGTSTNSCKDSASKSNYDDGVCEVNDILHNMRMDDKDIIPVCANCGKEGDDVKNTCNKCKQVKYCNATCKKKHRSKHKKACERRVAELHDIELFKQPPPAEDCPICFIRLPYLITGRKYKTCCGKEICSGCSYAPVYDNQGNKVDEKTCPFCRIPIPSSYEEAMERLKKRVEANDAIAINNLGIDYRDGTCGYSQDYTKALELYHWAADLELPAAYSSIGYAYNNGQGVKVDKGKALHYWELAAMRGNIMARYNLGNNEEDEGNMDRALKHYMIAVRDGYADSLKQIKRLYTSGHATKEDYTKALHLYQSYLVEIKSSQRDEAAAAYNTLFCYY